MKTKNIGNDANFEIPSLNFTPYSVTDTHDSYSELVSLNLVCWCVKKSEKSGIELHREWMREWKEV